MNSSGDTSSHPTTSRRRASTAARVPVPLDNSVPGEFTLNDGESSSKRTTFPIGVLGIILILTGVGWFLYSAGWFQANEPTGESLTTKAIPGQYSSERAYSYLVEICKIGPRPSASPGMQKQQQYLMSFFADRGAEVRLQTFNTRHPEDGSAVQMSNLIASWYPSRIKRYLLCAHYDTRPYPDRDRTNRRGVFVGANDGASGTAALMELSHSLSILPADIGVDIVLFDGEEFVFQEGSDDYFIGSTHFAQQYAAQPPVNPYVAGILLDMVGDRELKLYFEQNSIRYARDLARSVWKTAEDLGVVAFVPRTRHELRDDHLPLNQIARIPTIDIIDFDYPRPGIGAPSYWHTEQDTPENCSGESLAAVVWVVDTWLRSQSGLAK
jgi:glutaminyl-peptide cyclotransferase